ncbi:hypothetical protein V8G54_024935 [Vigna mungo]|uniref:Uncharacterized protein n=1 Tax=Vigna mungo TaxID=3915 RepID=A0AAQ3RTL9_VIGMU
MSGQEPSRPDKGKTVKKARKAKYVVRVPSEIPFSNARARPDVGSSRRPPPPSTAPTPSFGPTPSTIGPTPSTIGPTPSVVGPTPPTVVPTPSVVGQTPYIHPSSIPTPPSTPSPDVHHDSADAADSVDLDDPAPHDRPFIEPCGKGVASQAITRTIKQQFLQPWASWGVISDDDKKLFWERFKVGEHIWNSLLAHWNTPQYRINVLPPRKIGHQKKVVHYILEDPSPHMNMRFAAALGRAVHVDEVFTQTHIRKGTGEYVDERSRKTIEDFSARLTQVTPEGGSGADEEMIRTQCWVDTVGGKKKGRLYGVGQLASHYSAGRGGIFRHQPSTSTTFDPNNVVSKDAYDSLLARFENLENLVRTLVPQQGHTAPSSSQQPPFQTTVVQDEDNDDSDDRDDPNPDGFGFNREANWLQKRLSKLQTASRPSLNTHFRTALPRASWPLVLPTACGLRPSVILTAFWPSVTFPTSKLPTALESSTGQRNMEKNQTDMEKRSKSWRGEQRVVVEGATPL